MSEPTPRDAPGPAGPELDAAATDALVASPPPSPPAPTSQPPGPLTGRGDLVLSVILVALGTTLVWGNLTMDLVGEGGLLGPQGFGWLVAAVSYAAAVAIALGALRRPATERAATAADPTKQLNLGALAGALGGLIAFTVLLQPLGWLLTATLLFFTVSTSLGSRPLLRNLVIGFLMAAVLQLLFSAALGLALPPGVLGGW